MSFSLKVQQQQDVVSAAPRDSGSEHSIFEFDGNEKMIIYVSF